MNQDKMIDDLIKMLDGGMSKGVGNTILCMVEWKLGHR